MTIEGVDYAWGRPGGAALKAAGKKFVCRYVSTPGNSKNITAGEVEDLRNHGIDIVIVFETTANRALSARAGGQHDATKAREQVVAVGGPADSAVYFAVDWDATPAQQPAINSYLSGAASVLGRDKVGVYGGYWVVKRVLDAGVCKYAWQTYAWSGGHWDPRAQIQQYDNYGNHINGVDLDLDRATTADYGQWPVEDPGLGPLPGPVPKPAWFWDALNEFIRRGGWTHD